MSPKNIVLIIAFSPVLAVQLGALHLQNLQEKIYRKIDKTGVAILDAIEGLEDRG